VAAEHGDAAVAGLLGVLEVDVPARRLAQRRLERGDLRLGLLQADEVGVLGGEPAVEPVSNSS